MPNKRPSVIFSILCLLLLCMMALSLPIIAQEEDSSDAGDVRRPIIITPGVPIGDEGAVPTLAPMTCFDPLPITSGQVIFIEPGVNIRNMPDKSGALVWNTIFDNRDAEGAVIEVPRSIAATVTEGPVCADGFNWWRVEGLGNPGWVAEGRPDLEGGYFILTAGLDLNPTCATLYNNAVGKPAQNLLNARVRDAPGEAGRTLTIAPAGSQIQIIGGPQCVDDFLWWLVRVNVLNVVYEGWMAEGDPLNGIFFLKPEDAPSLEDGTLCSDPLPFTQGVRGFVNYPRGDGPKALRTAPGVQSPLLFNLVEGVPFIVEGGPVCRNNLNWWQIRVLSSQPVIGWMAEGSRGIGFWMSELDPDEFEP